MKSGLLFLITLFSITLTFAQGYKKLEYVIGFGGCFKNDTITVTVNGLEKVKDYVMSSDRMTHSGNLCIGQNQHGEYVGIGDKTKVEKRRKVEKDLKIGISINGVNHDFLI